MDNKLFKILDYTDIEYQLETILDEISEQIVIKTLPYCIYRLSLSSIPMLLHKLS